MRKLLTIILVMLLLIPSIPATGAELEKDSDISRVLKGYFDARYDSLSNLAVSSAFNNYIHPEILMEKDAINELDVLDTVIAYRKAQLNDLSLLKYKYDLELGSISITDTTAYIIADESYELYYKCAPTVKNSGIVEHAITLKKSGENWYILKDEYSDNEGVKKLLTGYFLKDGVTKEEAKAMVLAESGSGIPGRLGRLNEIMAAENGDLMVFFEGKPLAYAGGAASLIEESGKAAPFAQKGKLLLPLRFICEKLGATVGWDESLRAATIARGDMEANIALDDGRVIVKGFSKTFEIPVALNNGSLFFDAEPIVGLMGGSIYYDEAGFAIISSANFNAEENNSLLSKLGDFSNSIYSKSDFPRIDGSTATYPLTIEMGRELLGLDETGVKGYLTHNTTHNAYVNLIDRKADIIFVTQPSPEEIELARQMGIELEVVPICLEGFVFVANEKNPVNDLTAQQVRDIYQGNITNWKDVGGEDAPIIAYQREANSGSQTIMEGTVMKDLKMLEPPKEVLVYGMGELIDRVADYSNAENALGYSVYYYATRMYQNRAIKLLSIDGSFPEKQTIRDGSYPFTVSYYAVLRSDEPAGSNARRLLDWVLGEEGQKIVDRSGFVPVK